MSRLLVALIAFIALCAPALAATPLTPEEKVETDRILERGQLIYRLDRAAWVATDALRETLSSKDQEQVRGWIVEPGAASDAVRFYGLADGKPYWMFASEVAAGKVTSAKAIARSEAAPLTPLQARMVAARIVARDTSQREKLGLCDGRSFNTVVIPPPAADGPVEVYLMTPQMKAGVYPFGGHYKLTVAADDTVTSRPFTRTCLNMATAEGKQQVVALTVSHLLDPTPTEIHVFNSLAAKMPVGVATTSNEKIWLIEDALISRLK